MCDAFMPDYQIDEPDLRVDPDIRNPVPSDRERALIRSTRVESAVLRQAREHLRLCDSLPEEDIAPDVISSDDVSPC